MGETLKWESRGCALKTISGQVWLKPKLCAKEEGQRLLCIKETQNTEQLLTFSVDTELNNTI